MFFNNILLVSTLAAASITQIIAGGGFGASCSNYYLSGTTLHANCANGNGGRQDSTIDLNRCIANYGGNLACAPNGGFGGSCSGCEIRTGTYMICGPGPNNTPIKDLNDCVANYGGNLACAT